MRDKESELLVFGLRTVVGLALVVAIAFGCAILASLLVSGQMPWDTTGWQHAVAQLVFGITNLGLLAKFLGFELRRRRAKRD